MMIVINNSVLILISLYVYSKAVDELYGIYTNKYLKEVILGKLGNNEESVAVLHMQNQWSSKWRPFFIPQALKILTSCS